jgi:hypothetical protein
MKEILVPGEDGAATDLDVPSSGDQIARELYRLGVRHLSWARDTPPGSFTPASLLVNLAESPDARLRGALVPLFLLRPSYADAVPRSAEALAGPSRVHLVCAYSAAVALRCVYVPLLIGRSDDEHPLPDYFADELDLPAAPDPDVRLAAIEDRHAQLSGEDINWSGTYRYAVEACLRFADAIAG